MLKDEVRRMRKELPCWNWMKRSAMWSGGQLRLGCLSLLSEHEPEGDDERITKPFLPVEHAQLVFCRSKDV